MVVVVVTIRDGSRGSGPRLDCENLSDAKFVAASSLRDHSRQRVDWPSVMAVIGDRHIRGEAIRKRTKILLVESEIQRDD